jgi:hypothetical protein
VYRDRRSNRSIFASNYVGIASNYLVAQVIDNCWTFTLRALCETPRPISRPHKRIALGQEEMAAQRRQPRAALAVLLLTSQLLALAPHQALAQASVRPDPLAAPALA